MVFQVDKKAFTFRLTTELRRRVCSAATLQKKTNGELLADALLKLGDDEDARDALVEPPRPKKKQNVRFTLTADENALLDALAESFEVSRNMVVHNALLAATVDYADPRTLPILKPREIDKEKAEQLATKRAEAAIGAQGRSETARLQLSTEAMMLKSATDGRHSEALVWALHNASEREPNFSTGDGPGLRVSVPLTPQGLTALAELTERWNTQPVRAFCAAMRMWLEKDLKDG